MFQIEKRNKAAKLNDDLTKKRESAQLQIEQHSDFRLRDAKAWKRSLP